MIELPHVTVIIVDTFNYAAAIHAIKKTLTQIKPAKTVWFTDRTFDLPDVEIRHIEPLKGKSDYSRFIIKGLAQAFETSHCLIIQHDGYVLDGSVWDNDFLNYDYIGAPWLYPDDRNVGNGGFSLRSLTLQTAMWQDDFIEIVEPEDEIIGRLYRRYLEQKWDIRFAPEEVAHRFSYELHEPYSKTFGFHGYFHPPFQPIVVVNRTGAMGDVIQTEPVLHAFWKEGYRIVLKTLPQFYTLFKDHYFPVEDFELLNKALPYKYVDLDMAYEISPKQLHLKSYYEIAGIDGEIRNPVLNYNADSSIKIFKQKYACIHIDKREQGGRNIYGIDWSYVTNYLEIKGFKVIQLGRGESEETGALRMNTIAEPMLAYVISGCDLFVGCDSGPSHIAVATGRKCILFFGSVDPRYIHADLTNIEVITNHYGVSQLDRKWEYGEEDYKLLVTSSKICNTPYCWHNTIGTTGTDCYIDNINPPCTKFETGQLLGAINKML